MPLGLVMWLFHRATDVRHPILGFSQPRDEANPWMIFFIFVVLLVVISVIQIKVFRIPRDDIATYFVPCAMALGFVILNLLIPAWLLGWAMQDSADRGLGVFADSPNPANPARPFFRLVFAFVISGLIIFTEIIAVRTYLSSPWR
ncbi:MAG: hypothetical protein KDM63_16265 [Verrucomicrobiae bacterium]|nr:hypothetical protein [Verrucomicrobiae bacterium]